MGGIAISLFIGLFVSQANGAWYGDAVATEDADCPEYTGMANFELNDFMGHWYEIERYPTWWEKGRCQDAKYTLNATGNGFDITNTEVRSSRWRWRSDKTHEFNMIGEHNTSSTDSSNLQMIYCPSWLAWITCFPPMQFLVVDADYDSHAAVYSCYPHKCTTMMGIEMCSPRFEFLWIFSRNRATDAEPAISDATLESIHTKLDGMGIKTDRLIKTDQDGC